MTRLETIRTYFIERFFTLLTGDAEFGQLVAPAELFDTAGMFNVPMNRAGFTRIPTLAALDARIAGVASAKQKVELGRFRAVLDRTLKTIFGSLADVGAAAAFQRIAHLAPLVRHPNSQTYWPADTSRLLKYDDGTLRAAYHGVGGRQWLTGNLLNLMFENPDIWSGGGAPPPPFETRIPFVSTIGLDGPVQPFPTSPLTAGHLNLPAADARLTPGSFQPTLFAEVKSLGAALRGHAHYLTTAAGGGRFAPLDGNRIETDPLFLQRSFAVSDPSLTGIADLMLVFHGFYAADDGARRLKDGTGTNREFHHLACGILLHTIGDDFEAAVARRSGYLLVTASPTEARVIALDHPSLRFIDDQGNEAANGSHAIIYANGLNLQGYAAAGGHIDRERLAENGKEGADYDPEDWQWWVGLGSMTLGGAVVGFIAGGPIGAAIGAGVGLLIFLLAWALKKLFGGSKDRQKEWTEQEPWPGQNTSSLQHYSQPGSHDIGPAGATSESGGATPARSYDLKLIPHFPDDNLYGLAFAGADTFRVIDNVERQETLAWHAFEGGIGYQFDRPAPGRADVAGTSIQNYYSLFLKKMLELRQAKALVDYFAV